MNKTNIIIAIAALVAVSCAQKTEPELRLGRLDVSVNSEPEITVSTKASEYDDYNVAIFSSEGAQQGETVKYSAFEPAILPFGTYYVTAENCTTTEAETKTAEANGRMRLAGKSSDITLNAENWNASASVHCTVANSCVTAKFDTSVNTYLTDWNVKIYTDAPLTAYSSASPLDITDGEIYWINVGTQITYIFTAKFPLTSKDIRVEKTIDLDAAKNMELTFKVESDSGLLGGIGITVTETLDDVNKTLPIDPYNPNIEIK
ncbi:MAG: DUF4493 domain-containing protein [Candidatus Cryptobacteroides sp.]